MKEASKSVVRRLTDVRYATRFFVGQGIDIGAGSDPVSLYAEQFPLMTALRVWDMPDGDARQTVLGGEVVRRAESVTAAADDHRIVLGLGFGASPLLWPAAVLTEALPEQRQT